MFTRSFFFAFSLFFPFIIFAQTVFVKNSGFAPGNLWFSDEPDTPGETVNIHTLVWNGSKEDISGTISFFDNDTLIGKVPFVLSGGGATKMISMPWKVTEGYHKIYAVITDASGGLRGKPVGARSLEYSKTSEEEEFVSAPKPSGGATTTIANYINETKKLVSGYTEANLPKPVLGVVKYVASSTENTRTNLNSWAKEKKKESEAKLASKLNEDNSRGISIDRPFAYAMKFISNLVFLATKNAWVFYGIATLAVFFVFRFIKRKFFF